MRLLTQEDVRRYVRAHIFYLLRSLIFPDKSVTYVGGKFVQLFSDFDSIRGYSWGSACLAHLCRALCHASRWNHWRRHQDYRLTPVREYRKENDNMSSPYGSYGGHIGAWIYLMGYMKSCPFPTLPEDLGEDHCITLRGTQHHDWSVLHGTWVEKWRNCEQTILRGQPPGKKMLIPQTNRNKMMIKCHSKPKMIKCHSNLISQDLANSSSKPQPPPVLRPGRTSIDCIRPPQAISYGHSQGRNSMDSWTSGHDHQRGPILTQNVVDFNESTAKSKGLPEEDENSGVIESQFGQQEFGPSGSGDGMAYNLRKDKKKNKQVESFADLRKGEGTCA
ncbi:hypothetical protein PIB30_065053 [Stylosanthes scabra]|uniref:Aminotransferase-like plant mobile domain-containing protein n=1 Tax=Stylosanthes scabra TaxID=79078 RepID=A0ABU6UP52_9FABA|nr:hypothetical protein [Stylosanthes scabra]